MFVNLGPQIWLADGDHISLHHTHTHTIYRVHNKSIVTSQSNQNKKTILYEKCWWLPNRQKSPYHHADHKPNLKLPKDDSWVI